MNGQKGWQGTSAVEVARKWATDFEAAYSSHEAQRVAYLFAEDVDRRFICEDEILRKERGRPEVDLFYEKLFSEHPEIQEYLTIESARFLSADLMVIDGVWCVEGYGGGGPSSGLFMVVNKRDAGGWSVVSSRVLLPRRSQREIKK